MKINADSNYKIIKKIGEGGFGEVYLIQKQKKFYALKKSKFQLSQEEIKNLTKIIGILAKIKNENIIKYYNTFNENDSFFVLMEYGGDFNLKQFIKNKHHFIEENIIKDIIIQICLGLKEIHKNKIIHRDLTPDNIFIDKNNKIKIGDFGVSKILTTNKRYTQNIIGKHHYFAPEIEKGEKYNNKVDIYSLGCIIYELFTLNEYYIDKKVDEKECVIDLDIYNQKWQDLIDSLLQKDYQQRPDIEQVLNKIDLINKEIKGENENKINDEINNEIRLTVKIDSWGIGEKFYFLNNIENGNGFWFVDDKNLHDLFNEMNASNTDIFINEEKYDLKKYFIPTKEGIYSIKIILHFLIKDCSYMFYNCFYLKSVDLSSFDAQNVVNMEGMFCCNNLETIDLSLINTKNVTTMSSLFKYSQNLHKCNLPYINTKKVTNMEFMFHKCHNLESLDLSSFNTTNVKNMEGIFWGCYSLKSINLTSFNTVNVNNMRRMFSRCEELKSLDLSSFDTRNVTNMELMFHDCHSLKSLTLSSFDTKNVTNMEGMFSGCGLEYLDLSSFDTRNVTNMGSIFFYCVYLKNIDLSSFNTKNVTNMAMMFGKCSSLKILNLSSFDTRKVVETYEMFYDCESLEKIIINEKTFKIKLDEHDKNFVEDKLLFV